MKKLEIIIKILKEYSDTDVPTLVENSVYYNLSVLCALNEKYLTHENLNFILNNKQTIVNYPSIQNDGSTMNFFDLALLVSKYPNIINKLSNKLIFNQYEWTVILSFQPDLFDYCKDVNLSSVYWVNILKKQPKLITKYKKFYKEIDMVDLSNIVSINKKILKYIKINKINVDATGSFQNYNALSKIISNCPEVIKHVSKEKINKISISDWLKILEVRPTLIYKIKYNEPLYPKYSKEVVSLVSEQPIFKYLLPEVYKIKNHNLVTLISKQPQLIDELKINLKKLDNDDWVEILKKQPQLIDKCDSIENFTVYNWSKILSKQSKLIAYCNKLDEISIYDWYVIILYHPEILNNSKILDIFNKKTTTLNITNILIKHHCLIEKLIIKENIFEFLSERKKLLYNSKKYHNEFMKKYIKYYKDSEILTNMIGIYPDLKDLYTEKNLWKYVDFNQLTDNLEYSILK